MITRGTTPSIVFKFKQIDVQKVTTAYMTLIQSSGDGVTIEKDLSVATIGEDTIEWKLTQEETISLTAGKDAVIQCRYKTEDGSAFASKAYTVKVYDVQKEGVI